MSESGKSAPIIRVFIEGAAIDKWKLFLNYQSQQQSHFRLEITEDLTKATLHLVIDQTPSIAIKRCLKRSLRRIQKPSLLVILEPATVDPYNFGIWVSKFARVIRPGDMRRNPGLYWPNEAGQSPFPISNSRISRICMINSNQISFHKNQLYNLRRLCVGGISKVDLFGNGWDLTVPKKFLIATKSLLFMILSLNLIRVEGTFDYLFRTPRNLGPVKDKLATMSKYRFALIIENTADYISEKLYDALIAGCIPIYVGPQIKSDSGLHGLAVHALPDIKSIRDAIEKAESIDKAQWDNKRRAFLKGEFVRKHTEIAFAKKLFEVMGEVLKMEIK